MHREKNKGGWCHPHSKLVWSFKKTIYVKLSIKIKFLLHHCISDN
jgi:hypothetical protein